MYDVLEITTRIGCSNSCVYCPQDIFLNNYLRMSNISEMSFDTFKKCIDKIPKNTTIRFSGFTEPWLNKECTKMVIYAFRSGFNIDIFTTAVGMRIQDVDLIKDIRFIRNFSVHVPDNKGYVRVDVNQEYLDVVERLIYSGIKNLSFHCHVIDDMEDDIHPKVKALLVKGKANFAKTTLFTRAGNIKISGKNPPVKRNYIIEKCVGLKGSVLLPNGDVVLCCMDFGMKHILGNLLISDYKSLFKSNEYSSVIKGLNDKNSDILCRYCEWASEKPSLITKMLRLVKRINSFI